MSRDRAAAIALALVGGGAVWQARQLPYWVDRAPGPGFLPLWLGVLLVVTAGVQAVRATASEPGAITAGSDPLTRRSHAPALFALTSLAALAVPFIGVGAAIGLFTAAATWTLDRERPVQAAVAAVVMPVVVWLVFVRWLGVPFPR
jgi:putative tricarboxylic transport membrane protein